MKETILLATAIVLALCICPTTAEGIVCSIVTPDLVEINQGDYLMLAAVVDEGGCEGNGIYRWSSSIDGFLDEGASARTNNLSVGRHIIELRFTDPCGRSCITSMPITVNKLRLSVYISAPKAGGSYPNDKDIVFDCVASGGIRPYTYIWRLDSGFLSNQQSFAKDLPSGTYRAQLSVRDSGGGEASDEASFYVTKEGRLAVTINSPKQYQTISGGRSLDFSASATGGRKPYSYRWLIGSKVLAETGDFLLQNPSRYMNDSYTAVVIEVKDSAGETASSEVYVRTEPLCDRDGVCDAKESFKDCPGDCRSGSQDGFCDKEDDGVCDPDCTVEEDPDCICDRDDVCDIGREDSVICPLECAGNSYDGICDPARNGVCDPDCRETGDPDCGSSRWLSYLLLLLLAGFIVVAYSFMKKRVM